MNLNFFNDNNPLYKFRWFILVMLALSSLMTYADITGMRLFTTSEGQSWSTSGPGYHK